MSESEAGNRDLREMSQGREQGDEPSDESGGKGRGRTRMRGGTRNRSHTEGRRINTSLNQGPGPEEGRNRD